MGGQIDLRTFRNSVKCVAGLCENADGNADCRVMQRNTCQVAAVQRNEVIISFIWLSFGYGSATDVMVQPASVSRLDM